MDSDIFNNLDFESVENMLSRLVGYFGGENAEAFTATGETKYNFFKLAMLALDVVIGFSSIPLRIGILLGLVGEYIARVYRQVQNRPLYITAEISKGLSVK